MLTGKAVVVSVGEFVFDKNRHGAVLVQESLAHGLLFGLWHFETGPPVPLELCGFGEAAEAGDEAARRHGEAVLAIFGALDGDGQAIGDEEQATARGGRVLVGRRHSAGSHTRGALRSVCISDGRGDDAMRCGSEQAVSSGAVVSL